MWARTKHRTEVLKDLMQRLDNDLQAFLCKSMVVLNGVKLALYTNRVTIKYGITQVDSTVVVDGNGKIVFTQSWSFWLSTTKGCFNKSSGLGQC